MSVALHDARTLSVQDGGSRRQILRETPERPQLRDIWFAASRGGALIIHTVRAAVRIGPSTYLLSPIQPEPSAASEHMIGHYFLAVWKFESFTDIMNFGPSKYGFQ